ncbi:VOC family protein [Nocardioides caeni]|uniref:VOC family protein n=1 Tax=Nocardioides caeni TaxID=574700 RepID=A0A4S8N5A2_9ACTN|nr:VOC family protein [Nocardioides caeni]THV10079.1 VOC family protein [Nocardioides caeni]
MFLENVVFDAVQPRVVGRFWEDLLGLQQLTDEEAGYETRLAVPDGPELDLCFQQVGEPPTGPSRLTLEVVGPATLTADPEGNPVRADEDAALADGPLRGLALEVADVARELAFWTWLTGWHHDPAVTDALRHPTGRGPLLRLVPETAPEDGKNRVHLALRLEPGDDVTAIVAAITARGGSEFHPDWGDLPWRHFRDPGGNEFCLLPAPKDP